MKVDLKNLVETAAMASTKIINSVLYIDAAPILNNRSCESISTETGFVPYVYNNTDETNSPSELIKTSSAPDAIEGIRIGKVIFRNVLRLDDPRVSAASCNDALIPSKPAVVER